MVLLAPVLLGGVSVIFQAALYFHALHVARLAADEGLTATQGTSGSTAGGRARTLSVLDQYSNPLQSATVTVTRTAAHSTVAITGRIPSLLPVLRVTVNARVTGPTTVFHP
jgi:hypothetical protein